MAAGAIDTVKPRRPPMLARLVSAYRVSPFNPYWLDVRQLRRGIARIAPSASGTLLDVGVGERPYAQLFAPHVRRYIGLEYPPACENLTRGISGEHVAYLRGAVDVWGDARRLPFRDGAFDTVLLLETLEHVPDPEHCMSELARVVRPGGRLLVTVPFLAPMHALPYDFWRYTPPGLAAILSRHGFAIESVEPRGNYASTTGHLVAQWLVRTFAARERQRDGSVRLSRWRAPLVLPIVALVHVVFAIAEKFSSDGDACLGYAVVASKSHAA
jgi:ubiquinone/menaquinone biosynthesis C-methylase UbiE